MAHFYVDPLHTCIALGPLAMYFLVLGAINLSSRPFLTTGTRDISALGLAICGFVAAGPMELFLPERAAAEFGAGVWLLLLTLYFLGLLLVVLTLRPRLVLYNITIEQLRPALADVVTRLDSEARWAGDSLTMPQLGVQLHVEPLVMLKNVQLLSAGSNQNFAGWRKLEAELALALRKVRGTPNPYGVSLLSFGLFLGIMITYWLARDPVAVQQALNELLRR
jgi:hypothetical protein